MAHPLLFQKSEVKMMFRLVNIIGRSRNTFQYRAGSFSIVTTTAFAILKFRSLDCRWAFHGDFWSHFSFLFFWFGGGGWGGGDESSLPQFSKAKCTKGDQ